MPLSLFVEGDWCSVPASTVLSVSYEPSMSMAEYLKNVLAPALGLECESDDTVYTKIHTTELRVVFNNECTHRRVGELLKDGTRLIANKWPLNDPSTRKSLVGNASTSAKPEEPTAIGTIKKVDVSATNG